MPAEKSSGIVTNPTTGESYIPSSVRPDGTVRRQIKVRPGYQPPEDIAIYRPGRGERVRIGSRKAEEEKSVLLEKPGKARNETGSTKSDVPSTTSPKRSMTSSVLQGVPHTPHHKQPEEPVATKNATQHFTKISLMNRRDDIMSRASWRKGPLPATESPSSARPAEGHRNETVSSGRNGFLAEGQLESRNSPHKASWQAEAVQSVPSTKVVGVKELANHLDTLRLDTQKDIKGKE